MISLTIILNYLPKFNVFPLSTRQFGIMLRPSRVKFSNGVFNMNFISHGMGSSVLDHYKRCNTSSKLECIPLNNIENVKLNSNFEYDLSAWYKLVDSIVKARINGKELPSSIDINSVKELLQLDSERQRQKFLRFLFKKEKKKLADIEKKLKNRNDLQKTVSDVKDTDHIQYGIGKNTLLLRIWRNAMHKFYLKRLANSILFGQKIVFDLSYDEFMWKKERRDCAAQLKLVYSFNRLNPYPFDLYFCNATENSRCVQYLSEELHNVNNSLITLTDQSYLDIFPRESLVYLSPHAPETLKAYDHNAVYIIGGFVDTVKRDHISLYKSQDEGIKCYALPLDEHVLWGTGSKSLSINQVFSIMMTLRDTGEWKEAFKHIPTRKIRKLEPNKEYSKLVSDKMFLLKN